MVNGETEKLFGYQRAELVGQRVEILVPDTLRAEHVPQRNAYQDHPTLRRMGERFKLFARRKDRTIFPVEIKLSPVAVEGISYVVTIIRDSTELRKTIESRLELAAIVEASTDAIFTTTMDWRVRFWNKGAERLYGFSAEEMLGRSISAIMRPDRMFTADYAYERIALGESVSFPVHLYVSP